jgi:hypothetical protein
MAGLGPRSAIERAEIGNSRPTAVRACALLDPRERPITAGGVGEESAAPLHGDVGGLLHRLDRKVPRRLHHDTAVATHPGDNGRPILVVMAPPGLAVLAATPGLASQRLLAARLGLSLWPAV